MFRLSIPARQALARLTLPSTVLMGFALLLLGRVDAPLAERARMALADAVAPVFTVLGTPMAGAHAVLQELNALRTLRADNARLRSENERLLRWQAVAAALEAENAQLKASLHWAPDPAVSFVTARVVADAGGVYARSVLLPIGRREGVVKGEVALDAHGLVGRVTELGARSARVLLVTDLSSRIPVALERSAEDGGRGRAILVGTNGPRPRLTQWPEGAAPVEGELVVTSAEANAFPAGLPLGTVRYGAGNAPEVELAAQLDRLDAVRLFDYGPRSVPLPETPMRTAERRGR